MGLSQKSYRVVLERRAEKQLKAISKAGYLKISAALDKIAQNPRGQHSIKLTDSDNEFRYRIGDFRIPYTIEDRVLHVYVFEIVNRRDAYR